MAQFEGKVAVVTGGSRGIGRAIALAFGRAGARVAVTCTRQREAAEEVVVALQQMGSTGQVFQFDVADYTATTVAFEEIVKTFGRVDILVNNAGVRSDQLLVRMKPEEWDAVIHTNLSGIVSLCAGRGAHYAAPALGAHHRHHLSGRHDGERGADELCGIQGRPHRFYQGPR